jgi:hypothetical protein
MTNKNKPNWYLPPLPHALPLRFESSVRKPIVITAIQAKAYEYLLITRKFRKN